MKHDFLEHLIQSLSEEEVTEFLNSKSQTSSSSYLNYFIDLTKKKENSKNDSQSLKKIRQ